MIVIRARVSNGDIPNTSNRELINRRRIIDFSTNRNNDDLPAIKADLVGLKIHRESPVGPVLCTPMSGHCTT